MFKSANLEPTCAVESFACNTCYRRMSATYSEGPETEFKTAMGNLKCMKSSQIQLEELHDSGLPSYAVSNNVSFTVEYADIDTVTSGSTLQGTNSHYDKESYVDSTCLKHSDQSNTANESEYADITDILARKKTSHNLLHKTMMLAGDTHSLPVDFRLHKFSLDPSMNVCKHSSMMSDSRRSSQTLSECSTVCSSVQSALDYPINQHTATSDVLTAHKFLNAPEIGSSKGRKPSRRRSSKKSLGQSNLTSESTSSLKINRVPLEIREMTLLNQPDEDLCIQQPLILPVVAHKAFVIKTAVLAVSLDENLLETYILCMSVLYLV